MANPADSISPLVVDWERRLNAPIKSVTFYEHLFLVVLFGGGLGVWYTIWREGFEIEKISIALLIYFPAIVAATFIDLAHENKPYLRAFGNLAAGFFIIIFLVAVNCGSISQCWWAFMGTLFSIIFWWFANGENPRFKDVNPLDAVAGKINKKLPGNKPKDWKT